MLAKFKVLLESKIAQRQLRAKRKGGNNPRKLGEASISQQTKLVV